jgi:tyrosyl-tRNA synthetase
MTLLSATWHAWINDKLGGDRELIRASSDHVVAVLNALGLENRFRLVYAEDLVSDMDYWEKLLRAAKASSLARVRRALTIMGRKMSEGETDFSKLIYPLMQVTDINYLGVDVALGGMDQRRAHMLQRDTAEKLGWRKVIAVHTPLIPSLQGAGRMDLGSATREEILVETKMSKSKPESAIFIVDSDEKIADKVRKAYCPPKVVENNPVLSIAKHIIFRGMEKNFKIERPSKFGGPLEVHSYHELEELYRDGKLHPLDLKNAVAKELTRIVSPVREKIMSDPRLRSIVERLMSSVTR